MECIQRGSEFGTSRCGWRQRLEIVTKSLFVYIVAHFGELDLNLMRFK